jgi:uncharacterized membrane protein YfcA
VGRYAHITVLLRFGIPAVVSAFAGSWLLFSIPDGMPLFSYNLWGHSFVVFPIKFIVSLLLFIFALIELIPVFKKLEFSPNMLPFGGILSGFFGGLSGNQGALRSAFLIRTGLSKEAFVGTTVVVSSFVDFTRLGVYIMQYDLGILSLGNNTVIVTAATLSAITGAFIGNKLLKKVTIQSLKIFVSIFLLLLSVALGAGII